MDSSLSVKTNLRDKLKIRTKLEIIRSGMALFVAHGFDNVTVESICEHAGVSRATFFNYFPQKELVLAEMALSRIESMRELARKHAAEQRGAGLQDILDLILAFAHENEKLGEGSKPLLGLLLTRPVCHASHLAMRAQMVAAIAELLEGLQARGELKGCKHDPVTMAETLIGLYFSACLEWLMEKNSPKGRMVERLKARIEVAVIGILPRGGGKRS